MQKRNAAFTLIELLIVVFIIAILAALAMPNFLEYQVRAKVSRAKADMRSVVVAIEAYHIDNNSWPMPTGLYGDSLNPYPTSGPEFFRTKLPLGVTTPISYISTRTRDVFQEELDRGFQFNYATKEYAVSNCSNYCEDDFKSFVEMVQGNMESGEYILFSSGPDLDYELPYDPTKGTQPVVYDPTNGTVSNGDIVYVGPGGFTN